MNRLKPHLALLLCNVLWAMDYPFYNYVLPRYIHPMALVSASLVATALLSLVPLLWQKAEKVGWADGRKLIGAGLLIGVLRKVFIMYGLSMTSPIDGSIIDTIVPLLVLALSVALGMDRFTKLKVAGLVLGMAGAVAVVLSGAASAHAHSHLWGNVMIFLCACVTSLYMVWFKRLIAKYRITTVLRWVYCAAAVMALPIGIGPIVHTDFAAIARHALFPALFVLIVPTYLPNLDAQLCAQNRAGHRVEHLHLSSTRAGDRHFDRDGARQAPCGHGDLRAGDLRGRGAGAPLLHREAEASRGLKKPVLKAAVAVLGA